MERRFRVGRLLLALFAGLTVIWLIAPMFIVVPISLTSQASFQFPPQGWSFRWYEQFFTNQKWLSSLGNTLLIGVATVVIATPIGTVAALALSKAKGKWVNAVRGLMLTPMIVPAIIAGAGVYTFFLQTKLIGNILAFTLVHVCLALPMVIIAVNASLSGYDETLEKAAMSLGANRFTAFLTVTVPIIAPGIAAGAVFAFVTSFDEIIISQFMVTPSLQTLPTAMYASVTRDTDPTIAAAATMILAAVLLGFVLYRFVAKRSAVTKRNKVAKASVSKQESE
ncbi:ABC transporter permease [uncultured Gulosibacter sp.]|uniref:ABC transporter permease n=1 Tax=uncultured Gulosibacter sp. TaxID=1339167 RepID=UPI00288AE313|nr:ABC transporter permease [uncultured Gulosibacter sp.]